METKKLFYLAVAGSLLILGCGPSEDKKPTQSEIQSFKGTPLTPEQVAKLRGSMGGGSGPMAAGPHSGGGSPQPPAPTTGN